MQLEAVVACLEGQLFAPLESSSRLRTSAREVFVSTLTDYFAVKRGYATVLYNTILEEHQVRRLCGRVARRERESADHLRRQFTPYESRLPLRPRSSSSRSVRGVADPPAPPTPRLKIIPLPDLPEPYPASKHVMYAPPSPAPSVLEDLPTSSGLVGAFQSLSLHATS
ncbi:hypothetical protein EXIGLDRAFT_735040 [Exidia glandulosa HHB12029]|uniref:Uncharacterized protein n=1 Tax=Exidia glandulosa HHB12029 TaxID=1314781 RepID=A0A165K1A2_EXIGL|nr:hypothetical protein EXIGLDRAFT_735040 [Exidia glandulosa HHB12029]